MYLARFIFQHVVGLGWGLPKSGDATSRVSTCGGSDERDRARRPG